MFFFFNNIGITAIFEGLPEYHQGDGMTFAGVYQYAVYPWFMTLLFVVAGVAAYHTLQHKTAKQFISGRRNKLLVPSTLGVLVFGFIPGSIVAGASAGAGLQDASKLLNTPIVESYRFGIYTVAFLLGYYVFSQDIVIEVLKKWRFVSTLAAVVSGVYFIYRAYGIYYGHSSLLSTWYANLFTYCMILAIFGMFVAYGDKKNAVTEWLGKISFPVYILHIPVILIALSLLQKADLSIGVQYISSRL